MRTDVLSVERSSRYDEPVATGFGLGQRQDVSLSDVADLRKEFRVSAVITGFSPLSFGRLTSTQLPMASLRSSSVFLPWMKPQKLATEVLRDDKGLERSESSLSVHTAQLT